MTARPAPGEGLVRFLSRSAPIWITLLVSISMLVGFRLTDSVQPTGPGVSGIAPALCLNLAFSEERFVEILRGWGGDACDQEGPSERCVVPPEAVHPDGPHNWKRNTLVFDYALPLAYSAFFVGAIAALWRPGRRGIVWLLCGGAAVLTADVLENSLHIAALWDIERYTDLEGADLSAPLIAAGSWCSAVKWALVATLGLLVVAGLLWSGYSWLRRPRDPAGATLGA